MPIALRYPQLGLWLGGVVLLGYWSVMVWRLGAMWSATPEYTYGWAVPILCAMLFYERWRARAVDTSTPRNPGSAPTPGVGGDATRPRSIFHFRHFTICLATLVFVLARLSLEVFPNWRIAAWGLALAIIVITLRFLRYFGLRIMDFGFPIAFFLLAVPWPERFETPFIQTLTQMNAALTVELLSFLKVAAVRMGNIILIEPGLVGIEQACSGIRSFQSTLMTALFLGELFRFTFWRRVVFVFLGALLSFVFNIVRTSFLVWTCNLEGMQAVDKFHDPAGWSILGASVVGLGLIGWLLYRNQKRRASGRTQAQVAAHDSQIPASGTPIPPDRGEGQGEVAISAAAQSETRSGFQAQVSGFIPVPLLLLAVLVGTELGINWWFRMHEKPSLNQVDWSAQFEAEGSGFKPFKSSLELQSLLNFDRGGGWEWQGGGSERWQAFYFIWDPPKTLGRQVAVASATLLHQPESCFKAAGMQLREYFGERRFVANGVPLVFKVYEFTDRNIPIFVYSCTWRSGTEQFSAEEMQTASLELRNSRLRNLLLRIRRGERITGEMRVLKLGVWGPKNITEAEAAFQQQLGLLVKPK